MSTGRICWSNRVEYFQPCDQLNVTNTGKAGETRPQAGVPVAFNYLQRNERPKHREDKSIS